MDENTKAKHEMMTKILSWGTLALFLIVGYAINYHEKFEFFPTEERDKVMQAKRQHADVLRTESKLLAEKNDLVKSAEHQVKAAEADLEAKILKDDARDAFFRALGLVLAAASFIIVYFLLIYVFYRKFEKEMESYIVPKNFALVYAAVIGLITFYNALMTAVQ